MPTSVRNDEAAQIALLQREVVITRSFARALTVASSERRLLLELCRVIQEDAGHDGASVFLVAEGKAAAHPVASLGREAMDGDPTLSLLDPRGDVLGEVSIALPAGASLGSEERHLLERLCRDAAFGVQGLRLRARQSQAEKINDARLRLLEYAATHSVDELLQETLDEVEALTGSCIGFYHFVDDDQLHLQLQNWSTRTKRDFCHAEAKGQHYAIALAGVWVEGARQGRPVVHNDYAALPNRRGMPAGHAAVTRELVIPVIRGGKLRAILGVGNKPDDYDSGDVDIVACLADLAWEVVERRRAEEAVLRLNAELEERVQGRTRELERAHVRLLQAQKLEAIGALAAGIAHEINTPAQYASDNVSFLGRATELLTDIARASVALLAQPAGEEQCRAALEAAVKHARLDLTLREIPRALEQTIEGLGRIEKIVGAMKDFSHPSSGTLEPTDLSQAITTTLAVAQSEWKHVAEVETHFDAELPPVPVLRDELNQVLLNLIVNAAQAIGEVVQDSGALGRIVVSTRLDGEWAIVEVADTGAGIPDSARTHIFDPFFTTKPMGRGTGQGLAIAYDVITERHGGRISFESERGKGTVFRIQLPRAVTQVTA